MPMRGIENRMRTNPYQTYVEDEILTADPVQLVDLLYRKAIEAVRRARTKLASGEIKARAAAVTTTIEILAELASSLDHERGGELSARLAALYDYMQRRLIDANRDQADPPLAEVEQILATLQEAWSQVKAPAAESRAKGGEPALNQMASAEHEPVSCAY